MTMSFKGRKVVDIIAGTYDRVLFGLRCEEDNSKGEGGVKLSTKFNYQPHISCVTAVTAGLGHRGGELLVSGSSDETVRIYDLEQRVEMGTLLQHDGTIRSARFHSSTHLFTTAEDGRICVWSVQTWTCLKELTGHKGSVNDFSVHPSGKLALSVGKDRTLRLWNLVKGKMTFTRNLKAVGELVLWNPSATKFVVVADTQLFIYKAATCEQEFVIKTKSRISVADVWTDEWLVCGGNEQAVLLYSLTTGKLEHTVADAHKTRIRGLAVTKFGDGLEWLFTASSDGDVQVRALTAKGDDDEDGPGIVVSPCLAEMETRQRITCLCSSVPWLVVAYKQQRRRQHRKRKQEGADGEDGGDDGQPTEEEELEQVEQPPPLSKTEARKRLRLQVIEAKKAKAIQKKANRSESKAVAANAQPSGKAAAAPAAKKSGAPVQSFESVPIEDAQLDPDVAAAMAEGQIPQLVTSALLPHRRQSGGKNKKKSKHKNKKK